MLRADMPNILITGCSTGIGHSLATVACARGHQVVATMREVEGRNAEHAARLRAACEGSPGRVHVVELDVSDDASASKAVAKANELVGDLDALINNAGIGAIGLTETFTTEQMRALFEVNVFGAHRMCRAVLPRMRTRGSGLIVLISSTIGRIYLPYFAAYGPSKFALEALGDCYRNELRPTGVDVTIVQAGGFTTNFFPNTQQPADQACIESYGELAQQASQFWMRAAEHAPPMPAPEQLAVAICELVESEPGSRPARKIVDSLFEQAMAAINQTISSIEDPILRGFGG